LLEATSLSGSFLNLRVSKVKKKLPWVVVFFGKPQDVVEILWITVEIDPFPWKIV